MHRPARSRRFGLAAALLLVVAAVLASMVDAAAGGGTATGVKAADAPILAEIAEDAPTATQVFVNCPKVDAIVIGPQPDEEEGAHQGPGYQCEFRYLAKGKVIKGQDEVVEYPLHEKTYSLYNVAVLSTAPPSWKSCPIGYLDGTLFSKGNACGFPVDEVALEIKQRSYGYEYGRKPPRRLVVGDPGGKENDDADFVVEQFVCRRHARQIDRTRTRVFATCFTRFGDGIKLAFDVKVRR